MPGPKVFKRVSGLKPGRSVFDLSYEKKFTCDMGQLIPVMCDEMEPGATFKIASEIVIRFEPLLTPILHQIDATVHYFFVPYRILDNNWEEFITGGINGPQIPDTGPSLPLWNCNNTAIGSLWDYLGFPVDTKAVGAEPIDYPRRAYARIFNEFYRDETIVPEVAETNEDILYRAWEKDYFTSALNEQQRGQAPGIPVSGFTNADFTNAIGGTAGDTISLDITGPELFTTLSGTNNAKLITAMNKNTVNLGTGGVSVNVADLRFIVQVQKWLERNARAGARYIEFLRSHFGNTGVTDSRLDRPEFAGGCKHRIMISEVLQTSRTDQSGNETPQGTMAGHGITADAGYVGTYRAPEYGLMMGILSVMPKPAYSQGIDRQWLRRSRYDFYFPEFANLSEQLITRAEIFANDTPADNAQPFGYQGRYDELRYKRNQICGLMRTTHKMWHLGREFQNAPELNADLITANKIRKDIFAIPSRPGLIINYANRIMGIRPIPVASNPGLIDHN